MVLPISNLSFHSGVALHGLCWLYGCWSTHTVLEWSARMFKRNSRHVPKGFRQHRDPGQCLHGRLERLNTSLGGNAQTKVVRLDREYWHNRQFSELRWHMDNKLSVLNILIFCSSKRYFPDSQPVHKLHTDGT